MVTRMTSKEKKTATLRNAEETRKRIVALRDETQRILSVEKKDRDHENSNVFKRAVKSIAVP